KVDGLTPGHTHRFSLDNASQSSYPNAWSGYQAVASYDQQAWFRVPSRFDGEALHFELQATQPQAWFAYFEPYSRARHNQLIDRAQQLPGVELLAHGRSVQGRDIPLLRAGEGAPGKMNPDGAFLGHLRTNFKGQDLNRAWQSASVDTSPEVLFAQAQMKQYGVDAFIDVHGDEEIPHVFTAACEGNPGYTPRLAKLEEQFRSTLCSITADFQTSHGYTRDQPAQANMTLACNAVGQQYDCLSLTLEMPFKDHDDAPNVQTGWSGQRSKDLAGAVLETLAKIARDLR
ncbi:MAG: hypothetical protein EOP15_23625, partial [Pseudomonas sp.]